MYFLYYYLFSYVQSSIENIKNKFYSWFPKPSDLFARIFSKSNLNKAIIIFIIGFITRIIVNHIYGINVFLEYLNIISFLYYISFSFIVVIIHEFVTYFNINVIPSIVIDFYGFVVKGFSVLYDIISLIISYLWKSYSLIKRIFLENIFISNLKLSDFSLKSIVFTIKNLFSYYINDSTKLTLGDVEFNKIDKPSKISYVLNKDGDKDTLPNKTYKPSQSSQPSAQNAANSSHINPSKSSTTVNSSRKSVKTVPWVFIGDINELNDRDGKPLNEEVREPEPKPYPYPSSSIYSNDSDSPLPQATNNRGFQDFYLYDGASNFSTPSTMTPLFNNSRINVAEGNYPSNRSNNSLCPVSLNISNTTENAQNFDTTRSSLSITRSPSIDRPYGLSGNGVLPNVTFDSVIPIRGNIPLNNALTINRNLPLLPSNYENNLDNITDTPRIDDPCSFQYQSRHRPQLTNRESYGQNYHNITQEIDINKSGIRGKVKLVFKNIGSKFTNGINKIESAYVKYETVGKRHIIWNLFEENGGRYESYDDFKKEWDSKKSLWKEIKERTKKDLKNEIEGVLGFHENRPAIGRNMNKEIEDLLRTRRPFDNDKSTRPEVNKIDNSDAINTNENKKYEDGNKNKNKSRHVHKKSSHKHSHRHRHKIS